MLDMQDQLESKTCCLLFSKHEEHFPKRNICIKKFVHEWKFSKDLKRHTYRYRLKLRMFSCTYQRGIEASGCVANGLRISSICGDCHEPHQRYRRGFSMKLPWLPQMAALFCSFLNDFFSSTVLNLKFTCLNFCLLPLVCGFCTTTTILYSPVFPGA